MNAVLFQALYRRRQNTVSYTLLEIQTRNVFQEIHIVSYTLNSTYKRLSAKREITTWNVKTAHIASGKLQMLHNISTDVWETLPNIGISAQMKQHNEN